MSKITTTRPTRGMSWNHTMAGARLAGLYPAIGGAAVITAALLTLTACSSHSDTTSSTTSSVATSSAASTSASASSQAPTTTVQAGQYDKRALPILDAIIGGDFKAATADFDSQMQQAVPPDKLESAWTEYQQTFGMYQSHGAPQQVPFNDLTVVNIPLQMTNMPGEFRVTFHSDGTVAGLWLLKEGVPIS